MAQLYDTQAGVLISRFVQFETDQEVNQIINTSLDGTVFIQSIGAAQKSLIGKVYVTRAQKSLLEAAQENGNLLRADIKHGVYHGRITALKFGNRMAGDYFEAGVTLAREAVT